MRVNGASIRRTAVNLCLLLVSCVAGLSLCEASLRLFYPKYRHLAEAQFRSDAVRIWARTPNSRDWTNRPDTYVPHVLHHNNIALRQHRDFSAADLASATNIGVFGDSFTENVRLPVQYSFTEPLDYLLNRGHRRFNVLNFGVESYGPGQSLLHYEHFRYAEDLDHVFFVYCENDLWDLHTRGLFHLDDAGQLVRHEAARSPWWVSLISRLQTLYLGLDVAGKLSLYITETASNGEHLRRRWAERVRDKRAWAIKSAFEQGSLDRDDQKRILAIFRQLIRRWKHLAEHNGGTFAVVLLPSHPPQPFVVDLLTAEDIEVIDLYDCFRDTDPAHSRRLWTSSPYSFKTDSHWNEAGNRLAAVCLYRVLEEKTALPRLPENEMQEALFRYYAAFGGEIPLQAGGRVAEGAASPETAATIRERYLAFDLSGSWKKEFIEQLMARPDKRVIASDFDVYLDRNHLIYVKEGCHQTDTQALFFLHMVPVITNDLFHLRVKRSFNHWQFEFAKRGFRIEGYGCFAKVELPRYPIRYIRTGQYVPDAGRRWEGEAWIAPHGSGAERPALPAVAGERLIRADFDVYLNGRQLVYHKAQCGPADREPPFFLQVTPTDASVLPPDRRPAGVARLDFGACTTERELPAYAIRHIRTGQYTAEGRLWEVEFPLDPAGGGERGGGSLRRVRSVFDVTLDGRRLLYHKAACRRADRAAPFFVHVTPVEVTALPPKRLPYGFENLDFQHRSEFRVDEFGCTIVRRLPAYAIRRIRTGQYMPGQGRLWEGAFAMREKIRKRK